MNKLSIPTILVATILAIGIIALYPVEEASAVHDTILANSLQIHQISTLNEVDTGGQFDVDLTIDVDGPSILVALYMCDVGNIGTGVGDDLGITDITIDGALLSDSAGALTGAATDNIVDDATTIANDECVSILSSSLADAGSINEFILGISANDTIVFEIDETDGDSEDNAGEIDIIAFVLAPSQDTPTVDAA